MCGLHALSVDLLGRPYHRLTRSAPLVLIVETQDANKIGHAGSILVFGHSRNLGIGRGPAYLPKPHQEIGDVSHGVLPEPSVAVNTNCCGIAPFDQEEAGGRYAADLVPQLPARGPVPLLFTLRSPVAPETWLTPLCAGMT